MAEYRQVSRAVAPGPRWHVVCRDCEFEGIATSVEQAKRANDAHRALEEEHRVVFAKVGYVE